MIKLHQIIECSGHKNLLGQRRGVAPVCGSQQVFGEGESHPLQKVGRSIAYMEEHVNQPLQVSTLAALANVSPSHFFALFKQFTGRAPMGYFTRLRVRHACRLLDSTSASVKEVAAALGYDDPFYFSRVFKSISTVAPLHYRSLDFAERREIQNLLEPKDPFMTGEPPRRAGLGRSPADGCSTQTMSSSPIQQKTDPRT